MIPFRYQSGLFFGLLLLTDLCFLVYQGIQYFGRKQRHYLWPMAVLFALFCYEFLTDWSDGLSRTLLVNTIGLALAVLLMLLPNLKRRKAPDAVPPPADAFLANCRQHGYTPRETEIVLLVRQGLKNREIAERLFITDKTVHSHLQNVFDKTGVRSKLALIMKLNG